MADFISERIIDLAQSVGRIEAMLVESKEQRIIQGEKLDTVIGEARQAADQARTVSQRVNDLAAAHATFEIRLKRAEGAPWRFARRSAVIAGTIVAAGWAGVGEPILKVFVEHKWIGH